MSTELSRKQDDRRLKRSVFHKLRKEQEAAKPKTGATATAKYLRISPSKCRSTANAIRGKKVSEALQILMFSPKKAARLIYKVLMSAIANAENNFGLNSENLIVSEIMINEGPRMKRLWARSRGRADILQKRMAHITITVKDPSLEQ
jgi:large subunit ribosomal protein L22